MDPQDSSIAELSPKEAVAALERFVIDNDELLELEEQIGRFNIFDALGVVRQEIRHSNFLAWLLDPAESHGQGQLFLKAILMDLLRKVQVENGQLSPIDLDGVDLAGVEVRREWEHIDILIVASDPAVVIAIENKIDSGEREGQLKKYARIVSTAFPNHKRMFVYLTPQGDEPSDKHWFPYTYGNIHPVLSRCMQRNESVIGGDVFTFIRHYLNVIRGQLMNDPKIDDLCERIAKTHRQALKLIFDRWGGSKHAIVLNIANRLRADDYGWYVVGEKSVSLDFIATKWLDWLPAIGTHKNSSDRKYWIWCYIYITSDNISLKIMIGPTTVQETRSCVIDAATSPEGQSCGFRVPFKKSETWTQIYSDLTISKWQDISGEEEVVARVWKGIEKLKKKLPHMEKTIENAITECHKRSKKT